MDETSVKGRPRPRPPRKKGPIRRLVKILAICAFLGAMVLFITPYVLSADIFRRNLEEAASRALGVQVHLEDYSLSWFSGFSMEGVSIPNPEGFSQEESLLELRSMRADISFLQLLRGRLDLSGTVDGLEIRIQQNADGITNLEKLTGQRFAMEEPRGGRVIVSRSELSGLRDLRLDLYLRDALFDFSHAERGVVESLRELNCSIGKEFGYADLRLSMDTRGTVTADAVRILRYAVPLLAGAEDGPGLDFRSAITSELHLAGPAIPGDGESVLEWLDRWKGNGRLLLENCSFTPAPALQSMFESAGKRARLELDYLDATFTISEGYVETTLMNLESKGRRYGLQGRTSLDGTIDYSVDLTGMLEGHRDGERIREILGDQPLRAILTGSLDEPELGMPDLTQLLESALQGAVQKSLKDLLKKIRR